MDVKYWEGYLCNKLKDMNSLLEKLYSEVSGSQSSLKPDSSNNDFADSASRLSAQQHAYSEIYNLKNEIFEIEHALKKIHNNPDHFGICEKCYHDIETERLEVKPWARYCYKCKNSNENRNSDQRKRHY